MLNIDLTSWRSTFASDIVGESPAIIDALDTVARVAGTDCNILITGETGTGKELFARAAHRASPRRGKAFVPVNCAAIPETLLETELFGHVKGAYTGALTARSGRFVAASGGTIFLDEIGDLPLAAQAKLLRVLEERVVSPLGTDVDVPVDVRVVAATHRNLEEMVADGKFRADLYFRLAVVPLHLPALREREDDIAEIANLCVAKARVRLGRPVEGLDSSAHAALRAHPWPGNVRELAHLIERAVLLARQPILSAADLHLPGSRKPLARPSQPALPTLAAPPQLQQLQQPPAAPPVAAGGTYTASPPLTEMPSYPAETSLDLRAALENVEKQLIDRALSKAGGNRTEAAALLGLNRTTLVEKLRKYTG